jgi:hypothetical protein
VTQPKYAVFLPVRNGAAYVREAIDSVIAQTRADWTLVILDNASSDGTAELACGYADPRIHVHRSTTSLTMWESWHRVWAMLADGRVSVDYATIIGHDDRLLPMFLETIDRLIADHPAASLYQTAFDMVDEDGRLIRPCRPIPTMESSSDFLAARLWGLRDSVGTGYVFKAADYVALGGMPNLPHLLYADDLLFARLAGISFKVASRMSQCLYRLHRGSASRRLSPARLQAQVQAIEEYVHLLPTEHPDLMDNEAGRMALACFLAREIVILLPLATQFLLGPQTCERIKRLNSTYLENSRGIDYLQWLGTNFVSRELYAYSKRLMLLAMLLLGKLRGSP